MKKKETVVVAMSGGVDSSVVASLLVEQGYEVIGIMLRLWTDGDACTNRCCTPEAVADAKKIAFALSIPFYVLDYQDYFYNSVVNYFLDSYGQGQTPNPCLMCNKQVRFGQLRKEAIQLGATYLASGHYATIKQDHNGIFSLHKGKDKTKDQSYVLYQLQQEELRSLLFPLGSWEKTKVRAYAKEKGLITYKKSDSMDLCFLGDQDYRTVLKKRRPEIFIHGKIEDTSGKVLGEHTGLPNYTIGQRKGLGISASEPLYVQKLDRETNTIVLATAKEMKQTSFTISQLNLHKQYKPNEVYKVLVKTRYTGKETPATLQLTQDGNNATLFAEEGFFAPTSGQAAVFYEDTQLTGGGIIN